jgi:hypothetical protein
MAAMPVDGRDVLRCMRCGGVFGLAETINLITNDDVTGWAHIVGVGRLASYEGRCPIDKAMLVKYEGESVPEGLLVKKCEGCGRWWFPGNNLIKYKEAQGVKLNYYRLWGMPFDLKGLVLPIAVVVMLLIGVWVGVRLLRERQVPIKALEQQWLWR